MTSSLRCRGFLLRGPKLNLWLRFLSLSSISEVNTTSFCEIEKRNTNVVVNLTTIDNYSFTGRCASVLMKNITYIPHIHGTYTPYLHVLMLTSAHCNFTMSGPRTLSPTSPLSPMPQNSPLTTRNSHALRPGLPQTTPTSPLRDCPRRCRLARGCSHEGWHAHHIHFSSGNACGTSCNSRPYGCREPPRFLRCPRLSRAGDLRDPFEGRVDRLQASGDRKLSSTWGLLSSYLPRV